MGQNAGIRVDGLTDTIRKLNRIDSVLSKNLREELKAIAQDVVDDARTDVPVRSGRAAASLRAGADSRGPYAAGGKKAVPYYPWLDFGGVLRPTGKRHNTVVRDFRSKGRFLYPAIEKNRDDIQRRSIEAFEQTKQELDL